MNSNAADNSTPATPPSAAADYYQSSLSSISLACIQSLCDLLKELPMPSSAAPNNKLLTNATLAPPMVSALTDDALAAQVSHLLAKAKKQMHELAIDIVVANDETTPPMPAFASYSPLIQSLTRHHNNVFFDSNAFNHFDDNHLNQLIDDLKPSLTDVCHGLNERDLMRELENDDNNDNNDSLSTPNAQSNEWSSSSSYSSLGDRVKSRERQRKAEAPPPMPDVPNTRDNSRPPLVTVDSKAEVKARQKRSATSAPTRSPTSTPKQKSKVKSSLSSSSSQSLSSSTIVNEFEELLDELLDDDDSADTSFCAVTFDAHHLSRLIAFTSKLKAFNLTHLARAGKVCALLVALTQQLNVWAARLKTSDADDEAEDDERGHDRDHWGPSCDLCLIALNVFTARDVSSRLFVEETLEAVVAFVAFAVARDDRHSKRHVTRLSELIALLVQLMSSRPSGALTDALVLAITRIAMNAFFLTSHSNNELQLNAIACLIKVFQQYVKHRNSILEELLHSLARIPKRRTFDDGLGSQLAMFSALLLRLTHALFDESGDAPITREALESQHIKAITIMSSFLRTFMLRSLSSSAAAASSSDCDFRAIFDALVTDMIRVVHRPNWPAALLVVDIVAKLLISNLNPTAKNVSLNVRLGSLDFLAVIASKFGQLLAAVDAMRDDIRTLLSKRTDVSDADISLNTLWTLLTAYLNAKKLFREKTCFAAHWLRLLRDHDRNDKNDKSVEQNNEVVDRFVARMNARVSREHDDDEHVMDVKSATVVVEYIAVAVFPSVNRLFDASISHVTASLSTSTNTTQRSRAMKALSSILGACPLSKSTQLLSRTDLQIAMRSALLDASTSVREATIDLIGRFVLGGGDIALVGQYSDLIGERILDAGVSVRKRVIKILTQIIIQFPEFEKNGEICAKIVKRVNDECEPIRKLVAETCRELWFRDGEAARSRARSLVHVVSVMMRESRLEALQTLVTETLTKTPEARKSAAAIVAVILTEVLVSDDRDRPKEALVSAMTTVYMLGRDFPSLVAPHVESLQSLLSVSCESRLDVLFAVQVVNTLERVLAPDPDSRAPVLAESLLTRVEEDLTKNVLISNALVLIPSVRCLSTLVHVHTNNVQLACDLFAKFSALITGCTSLATPPPPTFKPKLLRAIFTCGLFLKHFNRSIVSDVKLHVIDTFVVLCESCVDTEIRLKALISLGFVIESDARVALRPRVVAIYSRFLSSDVWDDADDQSGDRTAFCVQTINNIRNYLSTIVINDEKRVIEWSRESLKAMTSSSEVDDSIPSQIVQTFLTPILCASLSASIVVRRVASQLVHVIHSGGHVHPLQLVPHLTAMTTDDDITIRTRADHVINEIERKFSGFVAMKARAGLALSAQLSATLAQQASREGRVARGFRIDGADVTSRLASLYHVIGQKSRPARRAFVNLLLRYFDVTAESLPASSEPTASAANELEFVFENLVFLRFTVQDEPLFVLSALDTQSSVNSTFVSQLFKDVLGIADDQDVDDDDDGAQQPEPPPPTAVPPLESVPLEPALPLDRERVRQLLEKLSTCYAVLMTRKLLKELYALNDKVIGEYSPNENTKVWEKQIHRRAVDVAKVHALIELPRVRLDDDEDEHALRQRLTGEWNRFKTTSLSGVLSVEFERSVAQLFKIPAQSSSAPSTTIVERPTAATLSDSETQKLIEQIRMTSCHVTLERCAVNATKSVKKSKKRLRRSADSGSELGSDVDDDDDYDDKDFH